MGASRFSFLIPLICFALTLLDTLAYARDMNMNLSFPSVEGVMEWSRKSYFGGFTHKVFNRNESELLVVVGMPTSGILTSQVVVFGRSKSNGLFSILLTTRVIDADVQIKEDARGVIVGCLNSEILVLPFSLTKINIGDASSP